MNFFPKLSLKRSSAGFTVPELAIVALVLFLVITAGLTIRSRVSKTNGSYLNYASTSDKGMQEKTGTITQTKFNCDQERNWVKGREVVKPGGALCDAGSFIKVDSLEIQTATGMVVDGNFSSSTESIKVGDEVLAKYVLDEAGNARTSCKSCGVTKL